MENPFNKFKNQAKDRLQYRKIKKTLDNIQSAVDSVKGDFNLENIYTLIGSELLKKNFSSLFAVYDDKKQVLNIKHYFTSEEEIDKIIKLVKTKYADKNIPLNELRKHKQAFNLKRAVFCAHRLKGVYNMHAGIEELIGRSDYNSIISPLVLRGEVMGVLEVFSPELQEFHARLFTDFTNNLARSIANTILFQEIKKSEAHYKDLFDNAGEGFAVFNFQNKCFINSNKKIFSLTGYSKEELRQLHYLRLFTESERKKIETLINNSLKITSGEFNPIKDYDTMLLSKGGEIKYVFLTINKTADQDEWFFIITDVTGRKLAEKALRESEEKYRKLVANAEDGVVIINPDGYIVFSNQAFHKIFGYSSRELNKLPFSRLLHPGDHDLVINRFQERLAGKKVKSTYEFKIIDKAGKTRHVSYSGGLIREADMVIGIQAFIRDITETKMLQEKIEWAKNHYEQVIDTIEDCICVIDRDYNIISFNLQFASKVRLPLKRVKNKNYSKIISRFDNKVLENFYCASYQNECVIDSAFILGNAMTEEVSNHRKDGGNSYHRISVFPVKNKNNQVDQMVIIIRDISERRIAEEEIRRLNDFNQRIIDTSPVSIVVLNKDGVIIAANQLANQLMAKPRKKVVGRRLVDTREIKNKKALTDKYERLLNKGEPFYYDNLSYVSELTGERKYLNIIAVPLFDNNKKIEGAISMALDNTEAMAAKQKLEDLNRNLERKVAARTRELDVINRKLSEVLDLKSKFIADASHELRTPLTVIQGNLDLAIREAQQARCEPPEIYGLALSEVERMSMILTDLTMLTNLDSNSEILMYEKVNLGRLIKAVGQSLKVLADQKRIALIYKKGASGIEIVGDEAKLEKLFLNIVRNGIKYTESKGKVKMYIEADSHEARVIVEDNGIGIPEEELNNIFERFYRVDKARSRDEGGTGLGLAIAKWIIEAHRGKISVDSKLGEGSKFTIHLPYDCRKHGIPAGLFN